MNPVWKLRQSLPILITLLAQVSSSAPIFEQLDCDSLQILPGATAFETPELDRGGGFQGVTLDAEKALHIPLPKFGQSLALRYRMEDDERGLPSYSREWTWSRPFPTFSMDLIDDALVLATGAGEDCLPEAWLLRFELAGSTTDIRKVPSALRTSVDIANAAWDRIHVSWLGSAQSQIVSNEARQIRVAQGESRHVPAERVATPVLLAASDSELKMYSDWPLVLLTGEASLRKGQDASVWLLDVEGQSETIELAAKNASGAYSLPLVWNPVVARPKPAWERTGRSSLRFTLDHPFSGAKLVWLDAAGQKGERDLSRRVVELDQVASGSLRLEILHPDYDLPLWSRGISFTWDAPADLRTVMSSDTLLMLELLDERGWTDDWTLEYRFDQEYGSKGSASRHTIRNPGRNLVWLRWKCGKAPYASNWSAWQTYSLLPEDLAELKALPAASGVELVWKSTDRIRDKIEIERIAAGDTISWISTESNQARLLDLNPLRGTLNRYRARRGATFSKGTWSEWASVQVAAENGSLPVLDVGQLALFRGQNLATGANQQGLALGLSSRDAMSYCNWLNERMQLDARYDEQTAVWIPGTSGGYRLPVSQDLSYMNPAEDLRFWLVEDGAARLGGSSRLRERGSSRRTYHLDAAPPDAGVLLVFDGQ